MVAFEFMAMSFMARAKGRGKSDSARLTAPAAASAPSSGGNVDGDVRYASTIDHRRGYSDPSL
jgi:hypothetical protein